MTNEERERITRYALWAAREKVRNRLNKRAVWPDPKVETRLIEWMDALESMLRRGPLPRRLSLVTGILLDVEAEIRKTCRLHEIILESNDDGQRNK